MRFDARVTSRRGTTRRARGRVTVADGTEYRARFLIAATGVLSVPYIPDVPGRDDFRGRAAPHRPLAGGAGRLRGQARRRRRHRRRAACRWSRRSSTRSASLTVYQRTANWCTPLNNAPITADEQAQLRAGFEDDARDAQHVGRAGSLTRSHERAAFDDSDERAPRVLRDSCGTAPASRSSRATTPTCSSTRRANDEWCEFIAEQDPRHRATIPRPRRS